MQQTIRSRVNGKIRRRSEQKSGSRAESERSKKPHGTMGTTVKELLDAVQLGDPIR